MHCHFGASRGDGIRSLDLSIHWSGNANTQFWRFCPSSASSSVKNALFVNNIHLVRGLKLTTSELKVCCLNHWTDALLLSPPYMEHDKDLVLHWPSQWSPAKVLNAVLLMQRKIYIFVGPIDLSKIFKIIQIFFWGGDKLKAFKNFFTTPLCTSFSLTRLGDL